MSALECHKSKIVIFNSAGFRGRKERAPFPFQCSSFSCSFSKNMPNNKLVPPYQNWRPLGNPGSASVILQTFLRLSILLSLQQIEFVAVLSGQVVCSKLSVLFFNQSDGPCEKLSRCPARQINAAEENQTVCLVSDFRANVSYLSNHLKCSTQLIPKFVMLTLRVQ